MLFLFIMFKDKWFNKAPFEGDLLRTWRFQVVMDGQLLSSTSNRLFPSISILLEEPEEHEGW